jgi:hypothetical protein
MRIPIALTCLLATTLVAQQEPPRAATPSAAERLTALQAEQEELFDAFRKQQRAAAEAAKAAPADGKPVAAKPMRPDMKPLIAKAQAAAADYAGSEDAVGFLAFICQNSMGKDPATAAAIETLTTQHLDSPGLGELADMFPFLDRIVGKEPATAAMERLLGSKNTKVRAGALLGKHTATIEKAERDSDAYRTAKSELLTAADALDDKRLAGEIRSLIDVREKYGAGNIAPDIEGTDLDGVAFKLSDYKGKVVFLDFWGDW